MTGTGASAMSASFGESVQRMTAMPPTVATTRLTSSRA
jgi:hypothetical protein